jgi:tetratricopeptide (TPR) repeat protein
MTREEWLRIKDVAGSAWDQPEADRAGFVVAACRGDEPLRHEVEGLLRFTDAASGLYETPALAIPGAATAVDEAARARPAHFDARVGPYHIARLLGHGGMGSVYLANRADGEFEHRVAIKFVNGTPSEPMLHRFRDERRILATLQHPNIAALLDGGTTEDGLPYVTMEYVAGVPIDEFCDSHDLGVRDRVRLFRKVCEAVQYAHQRLVVHRDIKAGNILVTPDGTPKLLDFGIAKIVDPGLPPGAQTATVVRALTPESASPEQVRGDLITIAADVYALGVLLYRLLAGRGPYGAEPLSDTALVRAICEEMPERPSAVRQRAPGAGRPSDAIERDLDLIVLKALRKEPDRRYSSVEQFADDLERYLDSRPVFAVPDSRRYRASKFIRRHRVLVAAAGVTASAIIGGGAVAVHQARVAGEQRARAEQRLAEVRRLTNSFMFEFHDAIAGLPGSLAARQLVVKRAAEHLDGLARDLVGDVTLQRELATANMRLGEILGGGGVSNLGDVKGAHARYLAALAVRETLAAQPNAEPVDAVGLAQVHVQLSRFSGSLGDLERAEQHARAAVSTLETPLAQRSGNGQMGYLSTAYQQLGFVQARRGENADALASLEAARTRAQQLVNAHPNDAIHLARLSRIQTDYGDQLIQAQRPKDAIAILADARGRLQRLLVVDPLNKPHRQNLILVLNTEGSGLEMLRDYRGAVDAFTTALDMSERLVEAEPTDLGARVALLLSRYRLAMGLVHAGKRTAGAARLRETIADGEKILQTAPAHGFTRHQIASARLELGETLLADDRRSREGCRELAAGLRMWREFKGKGHLPPESSRHMPRFERLSEQCESKGTPVAR